VAKERERKGERQGKGRGRIEGKRGKKTPHKLIPAYDLAV